MASKPRTKHRAFCPTHIPEVEGLPYSLETHKGEVLEEGTLGKPKPRGRGVTIYDQEGRKICGICPETGTTATTRHNLVLAMNNGRQLTIKTT